MAVAGCNPNTLWSGAKETKATEASIPIKENCLHQIAKRSRSVLQVSLSVEDIGNGKKASLHGDTADCIAYGKFRMICYRCAH